ncbi:MAG: hypothetical protein COT17_06485, partial [Elusimicrobia bacterium CG08_land_8_20_14_0_20_51_18]
MKTFIALFFLSLTALGAQEFAGMESLTAIGVAAENETTLIEKRPLLEMLAERDRASVELDLDGKIFYATFVFDADWNAWFSIKPREGPGAGAWPENDLKKGVYYYHGQTRLFIREMDGTIGIMFSMKDLVEIKKDDLFSSLYGKSQKMTFGDAVTYAVFRNLSPMSEEEGTVTLRLGSDGLFYYSLTPDRQIETAPRWLLAVNGVLYGMRIDESDLAFVSKKINIDKPAFLAVEKPLNPN